MQQLSCPCAGWSSVPPPWKVGAGGARGAPGQRAVPCGLSPLPPEDCCDAAMVAAAPRQAGDVLGASWAREPATGQLCRLGSLLQPPLRPARCPPAGGGCPKGLDVSGRQAQVTGEESRERPRGLCPPAGPPGGHPSTVPGAGSWAFRLRHRASCWHLAHPCKTVSDVRRMNS